MKLREELVEETRREWIEEQPQPWEDPLRGEEVARRDPLTWRAAVRAVVESHADTRRMTLNFERGRPDEPLYEEWSLSPSDRWSEDYQTKRFAELKAWFRELTGGERPSGGESESTYEDPYVVLMGLTSSGKPDGDEFQAPADHLEDRSEAWSDDVYHTLRNVMRREVGAIGDSWQYQRIEEPHKGERGGGVNHGYGHDHPVLVVDGEVDAETFRPVVEKWVESVDGAGEEAHDLDVEDWGENADEVDTVEVKSADDVYDVAAYVADYTSTEPMPFEERSIEYQMWAAIKFATNTRSLTRSSAANHAIKADACKQRYESDESDQDREHGELIVPAADGAHHDFECAECGSPWEIDQEHDTLTSARLANEENAAEAVADGGGGVREQELRERWPSARAAATVGERPPERAAREAVRKRLDRRENPGVEEVVGEVVMAVKDPPPAREVKRICREERSGVGRSGVAGFERPPKWQLKSVEISGVEHSASVGGGVDLVETVVPNRPVTGCELPEVNDLPGDPDRPETAFEDAQCRECGVHWHVSKGHETCPACGEVVDYEWNLDTGRISSIPEPSGWAKEPLSERAVESSALRENGG
jgi:hypothetical protein